MKCQYCGAPLRTFAESRPVDLDGVLSVACADLDACKARVDARRAESRDSLRSQMWERETPASPS